MNDEDYKSIKMPNEVEEKIKKLSNLDFTTFNKMQWNRINIILTSLLNYIEIYKTDKR